MNALASSIATQPPQTAGASTAVLTEERAQLAQMLRSYQNSINEGESTAQLKALALKITDAAKLLNVTVQLPTAATGGGSSGDSDGDADASSTTAGSNANATGAAAKLDVQA